MAEIDELGYFTARAVRSPLSRILGKNVEIPAFANHLNAFTTEARAHVLQKRGEQRRYFYRFENPSLRPFVILSGLTKGLITEQDVAELQTYTGDGDEVSDAPDGLEPLF